MRVGVPKESAPGERRVALVPEVARKLAQAHEVIVETGAGEGALIPDVLYEEAGVSVGSDPWGADVIVKVAPPSTEEIGRLGQGGTLIGFLQPLTAAETVRALADAGVTSFAMEAIPRISRAQAMDALSSQATVIGYKAVLLAADTLPRMFPLMMTAGGTLTPARVFVIGAGVAGLQAIATARRLGAVVEGYDIRPAAREQIESLGARVVELPMEAGNAQDEGGYARAMDEDFYRRQRETMA